MQEQQTTIAALGTSTPDYTGDRYWAKQLASRLQQYYHNLGQTQVKVWAEPSEGEGKKIWNIRSNIKFTVPK